MFILAVDTTTFAGSVALLNKKRLIAEFNCDSPVTYSERLLPEIHILLENNRMTIKDIEGYAVAAGPGSFTGIRIGMSLVKSLAFASGKSVVPVSTLLALSYKLKHTQNRLLCPVIDAKKNEIYAALFEVKKGKLFEEVPQSAYNPDRFFSVLPSHRNIAFIGNGIDVYKKKILDYFKDKARFPSRSCFIAHEVGQIGYDLLRKKKGGDIHDLEPLYLRKSQAEEKN